MMIHNLLVICKQYAYLSSQKHFHLQKPFLSVFVQCADIHSPCTFTELFASSLDTCVLQGLQHSSLSAEIAIPPAQPCENRGPLVTQSPIKGMGVNVCPQNRDRQVMAACYASLFGS